MNIALIIAGGVGQRTNQDIPKQFINVNDKPVIIYTLEAFQNHKEIDAIEVVCLDGWHDILSAYAKQFNITKLHNIISGGENGQASIRKGVCSISDTFSADDIILVHDAIRPMVSEEIISDCIKVCKEYGSAITSIPCAEAMLYTTDKMQSDKIISRDELIRTQTPQAFSVGKLKAAHEEALKRGITNSVASCTLMIELGEKVYFSKGSEKNIKLTTADDFEIFRALLTAKNADWFK